MDIVNLYVRFRAFGDEALRQKKFAHCAHHRSRETHKDKYEEKSASAQPAEN